MFCINSGQTTTQTQIDNINVTGLSFALRICMYCVVPQEYLVSLFDTHCDKKNCKADELTYLFITDHYIRPYHKKIQQKKKVLESVSNRCISHCHIIQKRIIFYIHQCSLNVDRLIILIVGQASKRVNLNNRNSLPIQLSMTGRKMSPCAAPNNTMPRYMRKQNTCNRY